MIVTPRVPTLVEESINVGTWDESETPEETPEEFAATSTILEKTSFMKQIGVTLIYVADALEKEAEAHEKMKKLADKRLCNRRRQLLMCKICLMNQRHKTQ